MQKNTFIIGILTISLVANGLFLYSKFIRPKAFNENTLVKYFSDKETNEIAAQSITLNSYEKIITLNGDTVFLNSCLDHSKKLFLVISDISCSSCVEESIRQITSLLQIIKAENVVVLGLYENKRAFFLLSRRYPFNFYLLNETTILKDLAVRSPVFFTIDINNKINSALYPIKKYPLFTEQCLKQILKNQN